MKLIPGLLLLLSLLQLNVSGDEHSKTNFIVFLADDLGWGDLACYGHPRIKTPHLDQFAKEGVKLTQCYSACGVCSPSRSAILTGRTPFRNGVFRWIPDGHRLHLRESEITIAEILKTRGYETCHSGKWHLNGHFNAPRHPQPTEHGFDHWFATQNNASPNHQNPKNFVRNGKPVGPLKGYSAPLVAEEANRWLREKRDPEKPFFLQVWTHEPHLPIESDPEFMKPYADLEPDVQQHHGNVTQLDHAFGSLMKTVDELGLRENTLVVFTSDNGPEGNGMRRRTRGSTGGLRGRKRDSHEGGIRVPGIVRWPGHLEPGTENTVQIISSDFFPTFCRIASAPVPKDRTIDGVDILPALKGNPVARPIPLFWRTRIAPPASRMALRIGDWKIVSNDAMDQFQLYQITKDWQESDDKKISHSDKLEEMKLALEKTMAQIEAEGPSIWWKEEPSREAERKKRRQKKNSGR
ncbi:MAG: sulfatase-like hydrolase/transferase [Verrucomicrobiota bacterium]